MERQRAAEPLAESLSEITMYDIAANCLTDGQGSFTLATNELSRGYLMRSHGGQLSDWPLFSDVSRSELALVRRHLTLLAVPAGRVLMREGWRGEEFMIIQEGQAIVTQGGQTVAALQSGDIFGELALLDEHGSGRRNASVRVETDSMIYAGSRTEFHRILDGVPALDRRVRQTAASRRAGGPA